MLRVTHNMLKRDAVYHLGKHQKKLEELQNNLSTGKKVRLPHEDPVAATHAMLYRTRITEIRQFIKNIDEGQSRLNLTEGAIRSAVEILHRLKELTVQASHGIYTKDDRAKIAVEVDELLKEMLEIANTKYKGESIFSGYQIDKTPFEGLTARPVFADREVITEVRYHGDIGKQNREIEQEEYAPVNLPGNSVFWATRESVVGSVPINEQTFAADNDYKIRIDGKEIQINNGDNIQAIIDKINNAKLPIQADLVLQTVPPPTQMQPAIPTDKRLVIKTTSPRQLWLEDIEGGNLLQQLGIKDANQMPNEISQNVSRTGMSIFDVMIKLRDDLWKDDVRELGSEDLGNLEKSLDNMLTNLGEIGARSRRFETVAKRLNMDELDMTDILAKTENIDFAQVVMDLQMMEYIYRSALATAAKIIRPTLMDFLR